MINSPPTLTQTLANRSLTLYFLRAGSAVADSLTPAPHEGELRQTLSVDPRLIPVFPHEYVEKIPLSLLFHHTPLLRSTCFLHVHKCRTAVSYDVGYLLLKMKKRVE